MNSGADRCISFNRAVTEAGYFKQATFLHVKDVTWTQLFSTLFMLQIQQLILSLNFQFKSESVSC